MLKSRFFLSAFTLLFNVGCVADQTHVQIRESFNTDYDGTYSLNVSCDWGNYGRGSISDGQKWVIKDGILAHKKFRFDVRGQVQGNTLEISGTRQSGKDKQWHYLSMSVTFPKGKVEGSWRDGNCNGSLALISAPSAAGESKIYTIDGSREYFLISEAINKTPISNLKTRLKIKLQYPDTKKEKYPLVVIVPSSQGMEWYDEIATAAEFRKLGYATLLVDSYQARGVGGDDAEIGVTINSPMMAVDALYALNAVKFNLRLDMTRTALYGASKGSLAVEETMISALGKGLLKFKVLLSENSNLCFDWSKIPLNKNVKLVVFTGGKDNSGTLRECVERTKVYKDKGYNITHINYPDSAHRFIITEPRGHGHLPQTIDAYGYKNCEWLVDANGNQGYRNKSSNVVTFPKTRKNMMKTIKGCLNRSIFYGGTTAERNQFFKDAHMEMQKVFNN